ncbi:helix-turn-helix transcriptional regulator [Edwardsiella tarda]|uniref:helix-turn-helix transcriptional regulator n=1 Tax=Edwardsiella tarda TaxID=636 RepID=UPI002444C2DD|nr:helix-turn-helix transcriptional regulator [Edwardsiella tarda]WGE29441.1 helix-turn-helix transcriptional regulator [Edwardsiella tarda]
MNVGQKIRAIRESEGLTRDDFSEMTDTPVGTLRRYETGRIEKVGGDILFKIAQHPRLKKYTMWLMTGETNEAAGQISPSLSLDGLESISTRQKRLKIG